MKINFPCNIEAREGEGRGATLKLFSSVVVLLLFLIVTTGAFAGGSSKGDPRTFGAYQVDFESGPVGISIKGHSATQVVTISEEDIPAGISIQYSESGGILHVKAVLTDSSAAGSSRPTRGRLVATMPRYEFVHIATSSGGVSIDNLSTDHLTIQTESGGINVTNTNAALEAKSTSGDQSYDQIYGAISAASTSGNVSVANTWGTMKLQSKSGSFSGKAVALAGDSSFRTGSGAIKIGLAYGFARYTFDLRSESGSLRLGQISRNGHIQWGSGNIRVTGVTDSGEQNFQ